MSGNSSIMLCGILINMPFDMHSTSCLNINFPHPAYVVCPILAIIVELNACGGTLMKSSGAVISAVLHGSSRLQATHVNFGISCYPNFEEDEN